MAIDYNGLEISPMVGCRVNCRFCPQQDAVKAFRADGTHPSMAMSIDTFIKCLDTVPQTTKIEFAGVSEPWLNPHCTAMALWASAAGHVISVFSTLEGMHLLDVGLLQEVWAYDDFCIHVPDQEGCTPIRQTEEYWAILQAVLDVPLSFAHGKGKSISCHGTMLQRVTDMVAGRFPVLTMMHDRVGMVNTPGPGFVTVKPNLPRRIRCTNSGSIDSFPARMVLWPDGRVVLCCMDWKMQHVMGNLLEVSYDELLVSEAANYVRRAMDDPSLPLLCRQCHNAVSFEEYDQLRKIQGEVKR